MHRVPDQAVLTGTSAGAKWRRTPPPPPPKFLDQYTTGWPADASLGATLTKNNARTQTCALILFNQNYLGSQTQGCVVTGSFVGNLMTLYQLLHRASLPYVPTASNVHWN